MTLMRFASWDAVKAFAGPDWEVSVVPPAARAVLCPLRRKGGALRAARDSGRKALAPTMSVYSIASSSSIMRSITERPIVQKPGSFASRPNGASSSE